MSTRTKTFVALGAACIVLGVAVVAWGATTVLSGRPTNVVVIMTDDQMLASMAVMPNVNNLLAAQGTTFSNYYVATPNCCPSRATYYRGQFPHNTGVKDNLPPLGGSKVFREKDQDQTLAVWMQQAGYYTMHAGKYLNGWGYAKEDTDDITPPPGWSHWFGTIDPTTYQYYNYSVSVDGARVDYGNKPEDYQTDVLGAEVVRSINAAADADEPFFVSFTPLVPHAGRRETSAEQGADNFSAVAAPRHEGMFADAQIPATPSRVFGPAALTAPNVTTKSPMITERLTSAAGTADLTYATDRYRKELESVQAVDEWIGQIYETLEERGLLDDTLIIFTSDNGQFYGEHGLMDKGFLYEEAVHVPLVVRGPGFPAGETRTQLTSNVDLAPTILDAAGATTPIAMDGVALQDLAADPEASQNRGVLLETWFTYSTKESAAIRVGTWSYIEWYENGQTTFRELYELGADPYQLTNQATNPEYASVVSDLSARLAAMRSCAGSTCER